MTGLDRPRIAVVMTVHNRRDMTVRAVRSLLAQTGDFKLVLVLLDDGSSDGTAQAVRALWPDAEILDGDGSAFWNGGMYRAWRRATEMGVQGYLWLNDDVAPDGDAVGRLVREWQRHDGPVILVGATRDSGGRHTYGAIRRVPGRLRFRVEKLPIVETIARAETFNGNFVLIDGEVVKRIGLNDPGLYHLAGDIDYGLRASKAGIPVLAMPGTLGVCEANVPPALHTMPFSKRWQLLNSHRGPRPSTWWRLVRRHSGVWAPLQFLTAYLRYFFPNLIGRRGQ